MSDQSNTGRLLTIQRLAGRHRLLAAMPARLSGRTWKPEWGSSSVGVPCAVELCDGSVTELATKLRFPDRLSFLMARGAAPGSVS